MPVKKVLLLLLNVFLVTHCFSQDSVAQRNHLSDSVIEHFFVLKSDPKIRQGPYFVLLHRRVALVKGQYKNGAKTGLWQFFDISGRLSERYNYDKKMFTYEGPLYAGADLSYLFDDSLKKGDRLTRPLKIGGVYFGYIPYLNIFKVPFDPLDLNMDLFSAEIELLISPMGRLADYKIRLFSGYYGYDHIFTMDISQFSDEDRSFTPATHNGIPVICRILIKCYVGSKGDLDFY
jgi:hypothetical protein